MSNAINVLSPDLIQEFTAAATSPPEKGAAVQRARHEGSSVGREAELAHRAGQRRVRRARDEAVRRGLSGWVRNRASGEVETVIAGEPAVVDDARRRLAASEAPRR